MLQFYIIDLFFYIYLFNYVMIDYYTQSKIKESSTFHAGRVRGLKESEAKEDQ